MPYLDYLLHEALPMHKMEARWLAWRAKSFVLIEGELYRRSHTRILQRCIPMEQGFYWPTIVVDAEQIMHICEGCQYYAR